MQDNIILYIMQDILFTIQNNIIIYIILYNITSSYLPVDEIKFGYHESQSAVQLWRR